MKNLTKRVLSFSLLACMTIGIVSAASWRETITVDYGVGITVNGDKFVPTDINGKIVNPFVYNGTTYVPLRGVSQALGCGVNYDANTKTAVLVHEASTDNETLYRALSMDVYKMLLDCYSFALQIDSLTSSAILGKYNLPVSDLESYSVWIRETTTYYSEKIAAVEARCKELMDMDAFFLESLDSVSDAISSGKNFISTMQTLNANLDNYIHDFHDDYSILYSTMSKAKGYAREVDEIANRGYTVNRTFLNIKLKFSK